MFGEKILEYWDDIIRDLGEMVAIPSVAVPQEGEYPFGKNAAAAIDKAVELCERYGLKSKNVDYYAMHAELGEGEENAVVMAHLDVVPEGEGWLSDPYTMVIRDGKAYGRGVSDNKSPAIVALHCLRALRDAGVVGKRKLRVVLGSAEEIGMQDMGYYFSKEQEPTMGFTPDSSYGICHCEKGHFNFTFSGKLGEKIKSFTAGTVVNAVPYKAEADVICCDGHVVNKVGTYQIAIAAKYHGVPYYVSGTPDQGHPSVDTVKIEMRDPEFVLQAMGVPCANQYVKGYYPAFDITPPELVTGVVTDQGVLSPYRLDEYKGVKDQFLV